MDICSLSINHFPSPTDLLGAQGLLTIVEVDLGLLRDQGLHSAVCSCHWLYCDCSDCLGFC